MRQRNAGIILGLMLLALTGCRSSEPSATYSMSYDQTYETVISTLNEMAPWRVVATDQLKGLITVETGGFFLPRRQVTVVVKRLEPFKTKVQYYKGSGWLDPKLIEAVDAHVNERALTYPR